jgi:transcriptional regulator with XRE-family HTH domain
MGNITTGKRIRRSRIRYGLSQTDLAEKFGVSQVTVSNWETSKTPLRPEQKSAVFEFLGLKKTSVKGGLTEAPPEEEEGGPSAIGSWLSRIRLERKMSVPELAAKAGLSAPAIYNIESGRISNPRAETIRRLEAALKEKVPSETRQEIREEATVEGVGEFFEFDPGIYVLYDISERPVYVGQGSSIKKRIQDHEEKFWFKSPIVSTAAYINVPGGDLRKKIETILIRFLKRNAVINKQHVER